MISSATSPRSGAGDTVAAPLARDATPTAWGGATVEVSAASPSDMAPQANAPRANLRRGFNARGFLCTDHRWPDLRFKGRFISHPWNFWLDQKLDRGLCCVSRWWGIGLKETVVLLPCELFLAQTACFACYSHFHWSPHFFLCVVASFLFHLSLEYTHKGSLGHQRRKSPFNRLHPNFQSIFKISFIIFLFSANAWLAFWILDFKLSFKLHRVILWNLMIDCCLPIIVCVELNLIKSLKKDI